MHAYSFMPLQKKPIVSSQLCLNKFYCILWEKSYSSCRKKSNMVKICPFWPIFGHFWSKLTFLCLFGLYLSNASINLPSFWYGNCSYRLLWTIHTLYARKLLGWPKIAQNWVIFVQNWHFWTFLALSSKLLYKSSYFLVCNRGTNHTMVLFYMFFCYFLPKWSLTKCAHFSHFESFFSKINFNSSTRL